MIAEPPDDSLNGLELANAQAACYRYELNRHLEGGMLVANAQKLAEEAVKSRWKLKFYLPPIIIDPHDRLL